MVWCSRTIALKTLGVPLVRSSGQPYGSRIRHETGKTFVSTSGISAIALIRALVVCQAKAEPTGCCCLFVGSQFRLNFLSDCLHFRCTCAVKLRIGPLAAAGGTQTALLLRISRWTANRLDRCSRHPGHHVRTISIGLALPLPQRGTRLDPAPASQQLQSNSNTVKFGTADPGNGKRFGCVRQGIEKEC